MGPLHIWPNIKIVVNITFQDICIDESKTHSKQQECNYTNKNVVISNIQMQTVCNMSFVWKMKFSYQSHTQITQDNK